MAPPKNPPKPVAPVVQMPKPEEEPMYMIGIKRVNGGYVVAGCFVQGTRAFGHKVHSLRPDTKDYAMGVFKTVPFQKIFNPTKAPAINLESEDAE